MVANDSNAILILLLLLAWQLFTVSNMAAGSEGEYPSPSRPDGTEAGIGKTLSQELTSLLETILHETTGKENQESQNLVTRVARNSQHEEANSREALEELVRAIVDQRFGAKRFSTRLVRSIAASLLESPEAMTRLTRLWREARES